MLKSSAAVDDVKVYGLTSYDLLVYQFNSESENHGNHTLRM